MAGLKTTTLFFVLNLALTFHLGVGVEVNFTINSTTMHDQDMTCSFNGSGAKSEIKGILQIDMIAIFENSERRLATVSGIVPKSVAIGQDELLHSFGNISGTKGVLRLKMKADKNVLKYACRVMVQDKNFRLITMEKLRKNKANVLLSMLYERFAGISSGVDLQEAFQKLEDKVEDTQDFLTDKLINGTQNTLTDTLENTLHSLTEKMDLNTERIMNDTEETVSEILKRIRTNEDQTKILINRMEAQERRNEIQTKSLSNKMDSYSSVLESIMKGLVNIKDTEANKTQLVTKCDDFRNNKAQVRSSRVTITNADGIPMMCDTETNGGGWTVFQRRVDGNVDFYRKWTEYENGFGSLDSSFWMGLARLSSLVAKGRWELRVDFEHKAKMYYAEYSTFKIGDASADYKLNVAGYSGTAGDSLTGDHNGMAFTTYDMDHDKDSHNCAEQYTGAFWYKTCHDVNLNGRWGSRDRGKGVIWTSITGDFASATFTEMKIRPAK